MLQENLRACLEISKVQLKLIILYNLALAIFLVILAPLIFGIKNLDSISSSFVLERFISLSGIIFITPLFLPEQDKNIQEVVFSKYTSTINIYLIRIFLSLILLGAFISGFIFIMVLFSCKFDVKMFILGTFATSFFLGSIGYFVYGILDNIVVGYLLPFGYYMINMFLGSESLKMVYLFSLSKDSFNEKYCLLIIGSLFIFATLIYKYLFIKKLN